MEGKDVAVANNRLRLAVQAKAYAKPYIQAITVLFSDGKFVGYDKLTASVVRSAWMDAWDLEAMFEQVVATNTTHYFPHSLRDHHHGRSLQHVSSIAHRVIDYRHVETRHAVIVLTIDETMLSSICNENWQEGNTAHSFYLLADSNGMVVSAPRQEMLGQHINPQDTGRIAVCKSLWFAARTHSDIGFHRGRNSRVGRCNYFQDQTGLYDQLSKRQRPGAVDDAVFACDTGRGHCHSHTLSHPLRGRREQSHAKRSGRRSVCTDFGKRANAA